MELRTAGRRAEARSRRKARIRKKVRGTPERPRLVVFRSHRHISAQVVDDLAGRTLCAASTEGLREQVAGLKKRDQARKVGEVVAARCREKGIESVVFDRNGYLYHGRVKALADGAREAGLKF